MSLESGLRIFVIIFCLSILGLTGERSVAEVRPTVSPDDISREAHEAMGSAKQYSLQQKETFQQAVREELLHIQRRINDLKVKSDKASGKARGKIQRSIRDLERKKDVAAHNLSKLKGAGSETWGMVRSSMNKAMGELKKSYQHAIDLSSTLAISTPLIGI